jgi:hypothetical protein
MQKRTNAHGVEDIRAQNRAHETQLLAILDHFGGRK